ncbi:hypothetical protein SAMN05519103_09505 [Rhizobiales bacterium GAS113]|nr:hypothetical protein SAMN05519103_09505 [Rhizobiales bacterium GAS113]
MIRRIPLLSACAALCLLGTSSLPASAEHGRNAAIAGGVAAGVAAGAILGGAMAPRPAYPGPYYPGPTYAPDRAYADDEDCRVIRHRVWVAGYGWQVRRERVCD